MKKIALLVFMNVVVTFAQVPHTFDSGAVAKASEVNENFSYLVTKIDSLSGIIDTLKTKDESLESQINTAKLPIGTIIGTMTPIDTVNEIWVLADGRTATTEYFQATGNANVPDIRGLFLRGLNVGRSDGKEDPDPDFEGNVRIAGSYQADSLKSHSHTEDLSTGDNVNIFGGGSFGGNHIVNTGATGGNETRPKNMAVFWYVKVK